VSYSPQKSTFAGSGQSTATFYESGNPFLFTTSLTFLFYFITSLTVPSTHKPSFLSYKSTSIPSIGRSLIIYSGSGTASNEILGTLTFPSLSKDCTPFYDSPTYLSYPSFNSIIMCPPIGFKAPSWKADKHIAVSIEYYLAPYAGYA